MKTAGAGSVSKIHPSHEMTEWESTTVTIVATPRMGQIRECENCGYEPVYYCEAQEIGLDSMESDCSFWKSKSSRIELEEAVH